MVAKKSADDGAITVIEITTSSVTYCLLGTQPMIFNRINEKAKRELLLPSGPKNQAERQANLKHDPVWEYRASPYRHTGDKTSCRFYMPPTAFKSAICTAALDMPKTRKSQIGRLCWIEGTTVDIYGAPYLYMTPVRQADINRTPDIRTRAILPQWAAKVTIKFAVPLIKETVVTQLLSAAGYTVGIGDYRQEKGKGSYGQYRLVGEDDKEWLDIIKKQGRKAQDAGLELVQCFDAESEDLLNWYQTEIQRRSTAPKPKRRKMVEEDDELEAVVAADGSANGEGAHVE
jgi:hypothetical protein